jgi:hypothetical protein
MIPISGFLEYGIEAVFGIAAMMVFVGWGLAWDGAPEGFGSPLKADGESPARSFKHYREAA